MQETKKFGGFNSETNDFLVGIKFNNNKEWFHAHKESYDENVHAAISALGWAVYDDMHAFDKDFEQIPKISRINRDLRFSKNKAPYKTEKWFFLRADQKPDLVYPRPSFFFAMNAEYWDYGLLFSPEPSLLASYRQKVMARQKEFKDIIKLTEGFELEGDKYKRAFYKDADPLLFPWIQAKVIALTKSFDYRDKRFYSEELPHILSKEFQKLYPLYKFLEIL
ncbi:MAG: DUF2461 domain-containing protein [Firmicutes bacterium]|nr:DUF2461 domain-containing protein [Bacillota bacterium]